MGQPARVPGGRAGRKTVTVHLIFEAEVDGIARIHPFAARALVLSGEFPLTRDGQSEGFHPGATFTMDANCEHAEGAGPHGAACLVARKYA